MPFSLRQSTLTERAKGDIFGLASRRQLPYVLDRKPITLKQISARLSARAPAEPEALAATRGSMAFECKAIIANAERSKADMAIASFTYFHGQLMGKPCVKVDDARAIDLANRAGISPKPFIKILRERAATGNPAAISALRKLVYKG